MKSSSPVFQARYTRISPGTLRAISQRLDGILRSCRLCPRECRVDRLNGKKGYCRSGVKAKIASFTLHFGEEPPISGTHGSGTIFFAGCTMSCSYCQNYPISQLDHGKEYSDEELAGIMITLQRKGAHNINLVTPTHVLPAIISALCTARTRGLYLPLVYNSSGYEHPDTLKILKPIVDIYMPDAKYASNEKAMQYSDAPDYPRINRRAIRTMFKYVGNLKTNKQDIALQGLIVRHLVLPGSSAETEQILHFLQKKISSDVYVSLMAQYHPAFKACSMEKLDHALSSEEYSRALHTADSLGLSHGWRQLP